LIPKWGGAAVYLHVNTKNVAAIRLYESCGFKVFERIENFYREDNENAFTMERKI
jgi:ribosomal protein S18 acetylase RimI-like enzyme